MSGVSVVVVINAVIITNAPERCSKDARRRELVTSSPPPTSSSSSPSRHHGDQTSSTDLGGEASPVSSRIRPLAQTAVSVGDSLEVAACDSREGPPPSPFPSQAVVAPTPTSTRQTKEASRASAPRCAKPRADLAARRSQQPARGTRSMRLAEQGERASSRRVAAGIRPASQGSRSAVLASALSGGALLPPSMETREGESTRSLLVGGAPKLGRAADATRSRLAPRRYKPCRRACHVACGKQGKRQAKGR